MASISRIYLDNAATSWPKPETVYQAVDRYQRSSGAPAGRSGYAEAGQASKGVEAARHDVARLLGVRESSRVIFTANGTDALNLALHGLLDDGDHVVTSVVEHNSVLRPLRALEESGKITVTRVGCSSEGILDPADFKAALTPQTRLVAVAHASNVTGALQPVAEIGRIAHVAGALLLIDAAQTLGHLKVRPDELGADLLASPGHKGLLGPSGTGVLVLGPDIARQLRSVRQGGTGTKSEEDRQPESLPSKYEAGSLNVSGILGLGAGIGFLRAKGLEQIRQHELELTTKLLEGLAGIGRITTYGPADARERVGVVSVTIEGYDPQEIAATLDAAYRVQVRPGLHCAPLMHEALGSVAKGGTVRFSLGPFTTPAEIDSTIAAIGEIASATMHV